MNVVPNNVSSSQSHGSDWSRQSYASHVVDRIRSIYPVTSVRNREPEQYDTHRLQGILFAVQGCEFSMTDLRALAMTWRSSVNNWLNDCRKRTSYASPPHGVLHALSKILWVTLDTGGRGKFHHRSLKANVQLAQRLNANSVPCKKRFLNTKKRKSELARREIIVWESFRASDYSGLWINLQSNQYKGPFLIDWKKRPCQLTKYQVAPVSYH